MQDTLHGESLAHYVYMVPYQPPATVGALFHEQYAPVLFLRCSLPLLTPRCRVTTLPCIRSVHTVVLARGASCLQSVAALSSLDRRLVRHGQVLMYPASQIVGPAGCGPLLVARTWASQWYTASLPHAADAPISIARPGRRLPEALEPGTTWDRIASALVPGRNDIVVAVSPGILAIGHPCAASAELQCLRRCGSHRAARCAVGSADFAALVDLARNGQHLAATVQGSAQPEPGEFRCAYPIPTTPSAGVAPYSLGVEGLATELERHKAIFVRTVARAMVDKLTSAGMYRSAALPDMEIPDDDRDEVMNVVDNR